MLAVLFAASTAWLYAGYRSGAAPTRQVEDLTEYALSLFEQEPTVVSGIVHRLPCGDDPAQTAKIKDLVLDDVPGPGIDDMPAAAFLTMDQIADELTERGWAVHRVTVHKVGVDPLELEDLMVQAVRDGEYVRIRYSVYGAISTHVHASECLADFDRFRKNSEDESRFVDYPEGTFVDMLADA
ncbi:MAG: hypothetical protein GY929_26470 [Actinomycetia bacterium]|nr:hypothetical protein [Actinomycetes bacterium]